VEVCIKARARAHTHTHTHAYRNKYIYSFVYNLVSVTVHNTFTNDHIKLLIYKICLFAIIKLE